MHIGKRDHHHRWSRLVMSALAALMLVQLLLSASAVQGATQVPATIRNAMLKGGVALVFGCYNSDSPDMDEFDAELPLIAAAGAGHVRYTCSMDTLEQGTSGRLRDDRYAKVLEFVNLAWSYGLVTTVDVHNTGMREPGSSDWTNNYMWGIGNPAIEARHTGVVTDLAARLYRDVPRDRFVLQPANEPIDQPTWYDYQRRMFASIRSACPDCTVMVMADDWQGADATVAHLDLSAFSEPIIVDVHFYEPIGLSHCTFPGMANNCPGKAYPGTEQTWRGTNYWDKAFINSLLSSLWQWRDQRGVFVNMGEFGTADALNEDVRARYLGDLAAIFREHGVGYTAYEWHHNFGIKQHPKVVSALFSGQGTTPLPTSQPPTGVPPTQVVPTQVVPTQVVPTPVNQTPQPTQIVQVPADVAAVNSFTLINIDTQQPVPGFDPIPNGATISLPMTTWNYAFRANVAGTPGSVVFGVNGQTNYSVDVAAPYTLDGDEGGAYYNSWLGNGTHTLMATPYSGQWGAGTPGATYSLTVNVTDQAVQQPPTAVPPTAVVPTVVPPTAVVPTVVPPTAVVPTTVPPTAEVPAGTDLLVRAMSSTGQALPGETVYIDLHLENPQLAGGGSILALEANCALQPVGVLFGQTVSGGAAFGPDAVTVNTSFRPDSTFTYATSQTNGLPVTNSGIVMTATVAALAPGVAALNCTIDAIDGNRQNIQIAYAPVSIQVNAAPVPTDVPTAVPPTPIPPAEITPTVVPPTPIPPTAVPPTQVPPTNTPEVPTVEPSVEPPTCTETTGSIFGTVLRSHAADANITITLLDGNGQVVATATTDATGSYAMTGIPTGNYTITAETAGHLPAQGTLTVAGCLNSNKPEVVLLAGYLVLKPEPVIDELDVVQLAIAYGQTTGDGMIADLDENGRVGIGDLLALAENLRSTGPIDWGDTQPQ